MIATGFTGFALDRAEPVRRDPALFAAALADPKAVMLSLGEDLAPILETDRLRWDAIDDDGRFALIGLEDGVPRFVSLRADRDAVSFRAPAMMAALALLPAGEAAIYGAARALIHWHARHGFCANCGHATDVFRAGWGRECPNCGAEHFPRVDPVVIMVVEHGGRALVGRQPSWPERRYSALAGFLEPGEAIEEAVVREVREEVGLDVSDIRYVASQPWPFPHAQLMLGCIARATGNAITLDGNELEDAMWVDRDAVAAALAGEDGAFLAPPAYAIAHTLLRVWVDGG